MSTKAISLARVSTQKQGEGHSRDFQLDTNRSFAERQGWTISEELFDVVSGADSAYDEREGLHQALGLLRKGEASFLVVYDASRIARQDEAFGRFLSDVFDSGGKLAVSGQGQVYANKFEAQELLHWTKAVATYEWLQIAKRTQSGKKAAMLAGSFIWPCSFGYRTRTEKVDGTSIKVLEIDPIEADMVSRICERYIALDTKGDIVKDFNTWSKKAIGNKYQFSMRSLGKIIERIELYAGGSEERTINLLGEDVTVTVDFPAIISQDTLQEVRKADAFRADRGRTNEITVPYKPVASCRCGENLQVSETRTLDDGSKKRAYICTSYSREKNRTQTNRDLIEPPTECRYSINSKWIDKEVVRFLKKTNTDDFVSSFKGQLEYLRANVDHLYPSGMRRIKASIEENQKEYDALVENLLDSQEFKAVAEAINAKLEKLKTEIEEDQEILEKLESNLPKMQAIVAFYEKDEKSVEETAEAVQQTIQAIQENDYETVNDLLYDLGIKIQIDLSKSPARKHIGVYLDLNRVLDSIVGDDDSEDFLINYGDIHKNSRSQGTVDIPLISMVINYTQKAGL